MPATLSSGSLLTQKDILSLPRPQAPIVNPRGSHAVWPSSSFDFDRNKTTRQFNLVDLDTVDRGGGGGPGKTLKSNLTSLEAVWLDDKTIAYLSPVPSPSEDARASDLFRDLNDEELKAKRAGWKKDNPGGIEGTRVWAFDVESNEEYLLGQFPVPISNLQTCLVQGSSASSPSALLAFSALVFPSPTSSIYTYPREYAEYLERQGGSDIRVYDSTFVRHWDEWSPTQGEKNQVFVVRLSRNPQDFEEEGGDSSSGEEEDGFEKIDEREGRWGFERELIKGSEYGTAEKVHRPKVIAPMQGTKLECPVGPFGSASDYTLSPESLVIHAKDPNVSPSWHTRTNVYQLALDPRSSSDREPKLLSIGTQGASSSPVFSPDYKSIAWLEMREDGYEADRNRVIVYDVASGKRTGLTEKWDLSPSNLEWTRDGKSLLATTEDRGHVVLYQVSVGGGGGGGGASTAKEEEEEPKKLTERDSVSGVVPLEDGKVLLSISSYTSPNELYLLSVSPATPAESTTRDLRLVSSLTRHLLKHKSLSTGEEFLFLGSEGQEVHGWILFPPTISSNPSTKPSERSLPLANLCHGGPQSSWSSSWSTRWNPQSYTARGYVTVMINRRGSTGFGQKFCDEIQMDWGGKPFRDLVAGIEYVKKTYKEVDPERMASLGASYGGYMQNWIQGHNDAFGFKCLVCHDGVFSLAQTYYSTEELYFPTREFGGAPWEVPQNYEKFSPTNFVSQFKTPQLNIHGSRDYRLVESEGLSVFNTLQRLGVPSRLLVFPSENHWVLSPLNSLKWHEEVFRWIGEWTNTN